MSSSLIRGTGTLRGVLIDAEHWRRKGGKKVRVRGELYVRCSFHEEPPMTIYQRGGSQRNITNEMATS